MDAALESRLVRFSSSETKDAIEALCDVGVLIGFQTDPSLLSAMAEDLLPIRLTESDLSRIISAIEGALLAGNASVRPQLFAMFGYAWDGALVPLLRSCCTYGAALDDQALEQGIFSLYKLVTFSTHERRVAHRDDFISFRTAEFLDRLKSPQPHIERNIRWLRQMLAEIGASPP